jgi:hypothetical protein
MVPRPKTDQITTLHQRDMNVADRLTVTIVAACRVIPLVSPDRVGDEAEHQDKDPEQNPQ